MSKEATTQVKLVVTGFGPFGGIDYNPSPSLVQSLGTFLPADLKACLYSTKVLDTSMQGVQEFLQNLDLVGRGGSSSSEQVVCIHIGVNYKGTLMHLEEVAYNDASFRIPDNQGKQPKQDPINITREIGCEFRTRLDLECIAKAQNKTLRYTRKVKHTNGSGTSPSQTSPISEEEEPHRDDVVRVSTDPGRFVCNYIYYSSLTAFEEYPHIYSLFLHVPPVDQMDLEFQKEYLVDLLRRLKDQVTTNANSNANTNTTGSSLLRGRQQT